MSQLSSIPVEVLEERCLTIGQFARACNVTETWVLERVRSGVLHLDDEDCSRPPDASPRTWRFTGQSLLRARRILDLERTFDADPELAALTADLLEEVRMLRRLLQRSE